MKILNTKSKTFKKSLNLILGSKRSQSNNKLNIVKKIINDVRKNGDMSLINYTKNFYLKGDISICLRLIHLQH